MGAALELRGVGGRGHPLSCDRHFDAVRIRDQGVSLAGPIYHGDAAGGPSVLFYGCLARSRLRTWRNGWGRQLAAPRPAGSAGRDLNLFLANYSCYLQALVWHAAEKIQHHHEAASLRLQALLRTHIVLIVLRASSTGVGDKLKLGL
jgi:hypothetical protein